MAAEKHAREKSELESEKAKLKRAAAFTYAADREQQRKFNKIVGAFDDVGKELKGAQAAATAAWGALKVHEDEVPLPVMAAAERAQAQLAQSAGKLTTVRKEVEAPMASMLKGVRESHMKHVGKVWRGEQPKPHYPHMYLMDIIVHGIGFYE